VQQEATLSSKSGRVSSKYREWAVCGHSPTAGGGTDFAFQLAAAEFAQLKSQHLAKQGDAINSSQIAMSSTQFHESNPNWSQFVTSSKKHRGVPDIDRLVLPRFHLSAC
jgi:hypothetical protein